MPVDSLFIGDPHIQVGNIQDVNLLIERLINLAKEKKPTFIVIGGDVLHDHERLHTLALNKAYELIDNMRIIQPSSVLKFQMVNMQLHFLSMQMEIKNYHRILKSVMYSLVMMVFKEMS